MATFSNNAETGASKDVLAENQEYGGSFDEKGNPVPPLDPAKAKDDAHTIRDCDSFAVNKA